MGDSLRVVVLISGNGSNLQALLDKQDDYFFKVVSVVSNCPNAKGLLRAANHGVESKVIDHKKYDSREAFDYALSKYIDTIKPDLIVLAGFMRILTKDFTQKYNGKIVNIHPSLLPKYKGLNTHARVLKSGDAFHGATVHIVNSNLDDGAIIMQSSFKISSDDDEYSLKNKVQKIEHIIYPLTVKLFAQNKFKFKNGELLFDDKPLLKNGLQYTQNNLDR